MSTKSLRNQKRRIGILTGGGDCSGLNAVIRAAVKTAIIKYGWEVFGIENGFQGLLDNTPPRPLDFDAIRGILPKGGTILGTTNRSNPFAYPVSVRGKTLLKDCSHWIPRRLKAWKLDSLIVIGGDGSLSIAEKLHGMGVPLVGIPKTIDNDLSATETTFGFDTAVSTATDALDKLHTTAESHHRVMVVEVMGRDAGWIALVAGIAGGADVILIPEIPFQIAHVCAQVRRRAVMGRPFSIVVVAEGVCIKEGQQVIKEAAPPGTPTPRLGGIGDVVGRMIGLCSNMEVRVTVLGHLQRGGSPTAFDRVLSSRFGVAGVELLAAGRYGYMVRLQCGEITSVPLREAISRMKKVDPNGQLVATARALGISFGDSSSKS
jgi:6-phosphofructokinase 1